MPSQITILDDVSKSFRPCQLILIWLILIRLPENEYVTEVWKYFLER